MSKSLIIVLLVAILVAGAIFVAIAAPDIFRLTREEEITPAQPEPVIPEPEPVAPEDQTSTMTLTIYYGNTELNPGMEDCSLVFPVEREVPETEGVARAALNELFGGPTEAEEAQGYSSFFSDETADILKSVYVEEGTAYVDIEDIRTIIPSASSSCGSAQITAEIETTLKQFPTVERVIIAIDSDPEIFYGWVQMGCTEENDFCDDAPFVEQGGEE